MADDNDPKTAPTSAVLKVDKTQKTKKMDMTKTAAMSPDEGEKTQKTQMTTVEGGEKGKECGAADSLEVEVEKKKKGSKEKPSKEKEISKEDRTQDDGGKKTSTTKKQTTKEKKDSGKKKEKGSDDKQDSKEDTDEAAKKLKTPTTQKKEGKKGSGKKKEKGSDDKQDSKEETDEVAKKSKTPTAQKKEGKKGSGKKKEKGSDDKMEKASPKKDTPDQKESKESKEGDKKAEKPSSPKEEKVEKDKGEKGSPKQQKEAGSPKKEGPPPRGPKKVGSGEEERLPSKEKASNVQKKGRRRPSAEKATGQKKTASNERLDQVNKKKDTGPNSASLLPMQQTPSAESAQPPKRRMKPSFDATQALGSKEKIKASPDKKKEKQEKPKETASGPQKATLRRKNSVGKPETPVEETPSPKKKVRKAPSKTPKQSLFSKIRGSGGGARSKHATWTGRAGAKATKKTGEEDKKKSERKMGTAGAKEFFCPAKVTVKLEGNWEHLDVDFSYGMVVRSIGKSSPLLDYLLPGDQLIGIGSTVSENNTIPFGPNNLEDALRQAKGNPITLTVVRPVGMMHCARKLPKRKDDHLYFIAEFPHNFKSSDLSLGCINGKAIVTRAEGAISGLLLKDDRILEFDGKPIIKGNKQEALDQMVDQSQRLQPSKDQTQMSCLVMRPLEHRLLTGFNIINSSLTTAVNAKKLSSERHAMGDDAREIGAREACRIRHWKNYEITVQSIVTTSKGGGAAEKNEGTIEEEEEGKAKEKKGKKKVKKGSKRDKSATSSPERRAKCKNVTCGKNQKKETSTTPTDVENVSTLQRVTPGESGLDKFRSFFHIN